MELKEAMDKIDSAIAEQKKIIGESVEKQESGLKSVVDTTDKLNERIAKADETVAKLEEEKKAYEERLSQVEVKMNRPEYSAPSERKSAGQIFTESDEYKSLKGARRLQSDSVEIGNLWAYKTATTVGDGTDRAPVLGEQIAMPYYDPAQRQMTLRQIMTVGNTNSNAIEYFREKDFDEDFAISQDGEGAQKAQGQINFEKVVSAVETIAGWLNVSRQVLDDAPMLQSYIDGRLRYAVEKELEDQILFGDGQDGSLLGIHNTPGVQTVGAPTTTSLDLIRRAIAQVRVSEYAATAIVLNPLDWAEIELAKGSDNHYIWVTVPGGGEPRLWRVPVIETTAMEEGRFLVGAFGLGAELWDRNSATIRITDSHSTNFTANVITILAEVRAALTVPRPRAFVKGVLSSDVST